MRHSPYKSCTHNWVARKTQHQDNMAHYQTVKMLPECALDYLLKVINRYWTQFLFPDMWSESIVIPFPKPGKDPSKSSNYRPIALTSCVCKVVERMINERLTDYLDMTNAFNEIQCGGRRHRSTTDHLVRLKHKLEPYSR